MDDELWSKVQRFGLTEKEADAYMTILERGQATVTEIATETNISKRHVYTVAKRLEDRQFVIVNDYFNPTTIEPSPPEEVYDTLTGESEDLYQMIDSKYQTGGEDVDNIKVLKSQSTVVNTIIELIEAADNLLVLSLPVSVIPIVRDSLVDTVDQDVCVLTLVFEGETTTSSISDINVEGIGHVVRYRDRERFMMVTSDDDDAFVSSIGGFTQGNSPINAIRLGQPYLEEVIYTALINAEWVKAEEIHVTPPRQLPHTYTAFRRAVVDISRYLEDDVDLVAEIEARRSEQPDTVVDISGAITRVEQRLVEPTTNPPPGHCCIHLRTDDGVVSVGGKDATVEEYRAFTLTVDSAE